MPGGPENVKINLEINDDRRLYDISRVRHALRTLEEFNRLDLAKLDLYDSGKPVVVSAECMDEWRFIGLSNQGFVELEFWKPENRLKTEAVT